MKITIMLLYVLVPVAIIGGVVEMVMAEIPFSLQGYYVKGFFAALWLVVIAMIVDGIILIRRANRKEPPQSSPHP